MWVTLFGWRKYFAKEVDWPLDTMGFSFLASFDYKYYTHHLICGGDV
jgi:hypothetical protein